MISKILFVRLLACVYICVYMCVYMCVHACVCKIKPCRTVEGDVSARLGVML